MKLKLENIQNFLKENAERLRGLAGRRDTSIGFNAFALVSDTYRKENFHSNIMAAILDPSSPHGEGKLFLRLFLKHLAAVAKNQGAGKLAEELSNLSLEGEIEVKREDGRVDIQINAIEDPKWTIVIENKINGAVDMERQLPRYRKKCGIDRVKAFVYLTAAEEKEPDMRDWSPEEQKEILPRLIKLVGFSETKTVRNLVDGWLVPCEEAAKGFAARAVLNQYNELVRCQAGETMNQNELKGMLDSLSKNKIPYKEFCQALEKMPHTLALVIAEKIKGRNPTKVQQAQSRGDGCSLCFQAIPVGTSSDSVCFAIDINLAALEDAGVSFWTRDDKIKGAVRDCESLLKESELDFKYNEDWMRFVWTPSTNEVFGDIDAFIAKIEKLVSVLEQNWEKLEGIAKGKLSMTEHRDS